jgi:hypothetical protein
VSADYTVYMVDDNLVVFPKTTEAHEALAKAGYAQTQITPYLQGFVVQKLLADKPAPKQPIQ